MAKIITAVCVVKRGADVIRAQKIGGRAASRLRLYFMQWHRVDAHLVICAVLARAWAGFAVQPGLTAADFSGGFGSLGQRRVLRALEGR